MTSKRPGCPSFGLRKEDNVFWHYQKPLLKDSKHLTSLKSLHQFYSILGLLMKGRAIYKPEPMQTTLAPTGEAISGLCQLGGLTENPIS